jgi:type IV pilus assembly protein PilW
MKRRMTTMPGACTGFSIVELMVAMVISLIVLAAVSSVMVSTKKTNTAQVAQARMQDNARIAVQIMARDIRQAGYFGCSTPTVGSVTNTLYDKVDGTGPKIGDYSLPLVGAEAGATTIEPEGETVPKNALAASDLIGIRYADGSDPITIETPYMNNKSANIKVSTPNGLQDDDIVMVTDCQSAAIFQITNANSGVLVHNTGAGDPGNSTKDLGKTYTGEARIVKFASNLYFVANSETSGQPSLFRMNAAEYAAAVADTDQSVAAWTGHSDELVEGIEQIQLTYGIDTSSPYDGIVDKYVDASALTSAEAWKHVYTVRLGVLARTLANNTVAGDKGTASGTATELDSKKYDVDGDGTDDVDASTLSTAERRYQRHVFRTTILVRNHATAQTN